MTSQWDRLELVGRGELLYAAGMPLPLRHQPGHDLQQLSTTRHGLDVSLRCSRGLVSAELVIDLGTGADLAAAERVRDGQLAHHCQLLLELLDLRVDGCQHLVAPGRGSVLLSAPQPLPRALWSRATGGLSAARALEPFTAGGDEHAAAGLSRWWTLRDTTPHVAARGGSNRDSTKIEPRPHRDPTEIPPSSSSCGFGRGERSRAAPLS